MIYVNGDSWTSGWPDEETFGHREFSWPHLLSLKLNETVINDARAGSSNYRIYRRTFDYLLNNKPELAIVCLTQWGRFEIGNAVTGKIVQIIPTQNPEEYKDKWYPYLLYSNLLRQILSLQFLATAQGTNLLFLDTFSNNLNRSPSLEWFKDLLKLSLAFDAMDDSRIESKFSKILDLTNKINYNQFLSSMSYQEIIKDCKMSKDHPVIDGHKKIADFIYKKLKENNHGQTI